jgi:transposase-like protein
VNSSNKKFKCPHCEQTSNKKSNIKIHIQRKHKKQIVYDKYGSQVYQKDLNQNTESMPIDVKNSFQQPSSLFYYSQFTPSNEYYYFKIKEEEEEEEERKRKNERRYRNMLNLCSKFCARQYKINLNYYNNYNNQPTSFPLYIISNSKQQTTIPNQCSTINSNLQTSNSTSKIPYAFKFYKCSGCLNEMLFPIYNFKDIATIKKINYDSFCQLFHKIYPLANLGKFLKNCLLEYIKTNAARENTTLKTITIPNLFIKTPIPLKLIESLSKIYAFNDPIRWLFELLTVDRFIEAGEKGSDHWAIRAYNSNNIVLDRNELKEFVTITDASFGLIEFKIDHVSKYMFSWIPFEAL